MAKEDFYGVWNIHDTSGTAFGLGTTITISESQEENEVEIELHPAAGSELKAIYDGDREALKVTGIFNTEVMYVSRFVDQADRYRGIYGLAFMTTLNAAGRHRTAVFMAAAEIGTISSRESTGSRTIGGRDFEAEYVVETTTGAQFGKGSSIHVEAAENEEFYLSVIHVNGESNTVGMVFDESVCALRSPLAVSSESEVRLQASLAEDDDGRKYTYGLSVVGDPDEAGAWGGGEEEPPTPAEDL